ncbi:MAG: DnaD domain protein, partial [Traorella sp.]
INILIEHILKTNQNRLDRNYVTKIASVWVRNGVDTKEKAIEACQPVKTKKTYSKTTRTLPEWYKNDEEDFEEASEDRIEEFEKMLEELK